METVIEKTTSIEQSIARESLPKVRKLVRSFNPRSESVSIQVNQDDVNIVLPLKLLNVLQTILDLMAEGKAFSLMPANAELTTQEAADLLNVSRPFITKLLKQNLISYNQVGTHRRIPLEDLIRYMAKMKRERKESLDDLADLGQQYNM